MAVGSSSGAGAGTQPPFSNFFSAFRACSRAAWPLQQVREGTWTFQSEMSSNMSKARASSEVFRRCEYFKVCVSRASLLN